MKLINKTLMMIALGTVCMISSVAMADLLKRIPAPVNCGKGYYNAFSQNCINTCPENATCDGVTAKCKSGYVNANAGKRNMPVKCVEN